MANITNASSPLVAIIAVTTAPTPTSRWEYMPTTVNAPRQPGVTPSNAAIPYWLHRFRANLFCHTPLVRTFTYSITSIIMKTKPVMLSALVKTCSTRAPCHLVVTDRMVTKHRIRSSNCNYISATQLPNHQDHGSRFRPEWTMVRVFGDHPVRTGSVTFSRRFILPFQDVVVFDKYV